MNFAIDKTINMFSFFKNLFGPGTDYKALVEAGAIIIDVRSPQEFDGGHIKGSKNIPVNIKTLLVIQTFSRWEIFLLMEEV